MSGEQRPPWIATLLLRLAASRGERTFLLGDLEEEYRALRREWNAEAAGAWYWKQALRSAGPLLLARAAGRAGARSVAAGLVGVAVAIGSTLLAGQALRLLVGPCEGLPFAAVCLGVAGIALISSTGAGCAARRVAGRRDPAALALIGFVVVAPEVAYTLHAGQAAAAHAGLIPLALAVAATGLGLAISARPHAAALDPLVPGGPS